MNSAIQRPAEHDRERMFGNNALLGFNRGICEIHAGGVMGDRAGVEQFQRNAVGEHAPTADQPRVEKIKPFVARPRDLSVFVGDKNSIALIERKLRRPYLDLKRHWSTAVTGGDVRTTDPARPPNAQP